MSLAVALTFSTGLASAVSTYTVDENPMPGAEVTQSIYHNTLSRGLTFPYGYYQSEFPTLNDLGHIAGQTDLANSPYSLIRGAITGQAAVWKSGVLHSLPMYLPSIRSYPACRDTNGDGISDATTCESRVVAINNNGTAAGSSHISLAGVESYEEQGMSWLTDANGQYTGDIKRNLSLYSGFGQSQIQDINEGGTVVGYGITNGGGGPQDGLMHGLVKLSPFNQSRYIGGTGQSSRAHAINESTEVTGGALIGAGASEMRVYIWKEDGTIEGNLQFGGTLSGGDYSEGYDINDSGLVVGRATDSSNRIRAFKWQSSNIGGALEDIGTLGGTESVARAINNAGQIVGRSQTSNGEGHAFIYENGQMYDLNDYASGKPGFVIVDAYSINENGQVLVRALKNIVNGPDENEYWLLTSGASQNLLTNPGFETGDKTGWEGVGTVQSAVVHSGANAIALTGDPLSWPGVHQTVAITEGNSYRFTSWLNVQGLTTGSFYYQVSWQDNNGNQLGATDTFAWVTANSTFEKYESVFTAPSGATQVFFKIQANNTDGTGYIDSLSIVDTAFDETPPPGDNLLINSGFETGDKTGWQGVGTVQSAIVHSGANAIALTGDPSSWPGVHQTVAITGGNSYRFTSWLRVQGLTTGSFYFQVNWQDDFGNQVGATDTFAWVTANGAFEKYESVFTAPSGATQVFFKIQANETDGTGYIDSLSIVDTAFDETPPPGSNLLTNPGFETGDKTGWQGVGSVQSGVVHLGANAIELVGNPTSWPGGHQTVSITEGNEYRFTGWLSVQDITTGSFYFQVSWQDSDGNQVGTTDSFAWVTANGTFEKYESVFTAPSGATQVFFKFQANNTDGRGYFDSLSVKDTAFE